MTKFRVMAWLLLASLPSMATSAAAQAITQADRTEVAARIAAFDAAVRENRLEDVLDFLPPRVVDSIAKKAGTTAGEIRPVLAAQMAEAFKMVKLVSFGMDLKTATSALTPDGRRGYMLVPTETLMELPDGHRLRSRSNTVVLKDAGQWYVVRIDNAQQILMLRDVYPEFAGVDFPPGSMAAAD